MKEVVEDIRQHPEQWFNNEAQVQAYFAAQQPEAEIPKKPAKQMAPASPDRLGDAKRERGLAPGNIVPARVILRRRQLCKSPVRAG